MKLRERKGHKRLDADGPGVGALRSDRSGQAAGGATALMLADMMKCGDSVKALKAAGARK